MEPCLGLRLVRGPDWCCGDQDGGEGSVGTLVEVGEGGRSALVQWDGGTRGRYRCGEDDKFELRVLDTAPTGLQFPDIICSGCYVEGVAGIYWQCTHCYEYHLCHTCYLLGRHCQEHPFFRVEAKQQTTRLKVSCRAGAERVEAKGVFVGAEVVRGPNWRFGDQDGGTGKKGRVVAIEGYKTLTARSIAVVKWDSEGLANIYRVGHKGKVDLCCTVAGSGGYYCPKHLCILGCSATVAPFDEEEIVVGDLVKVELDPELFKMMHKAAGVWKDNMSALFDGSAYTLYVLSVLEQRRLLVGIRAKGVYIVCCDAMIKLKHCGVGQTVRIISDLTVLRQLQSELWRKNIFMTAGQTGRVIKKHIDGTLQVYVRGRGWLFNPLCLEPAPGETAPYTPDPLNECTVGYNVTRKVCREEYQQALVNEPLLNGDLTALESFIYSNQIQVDVKATIFGYYVTMGMMDALRLVLKCDEIAPLIKTGIKMCVCILRQNVAAVAAMLEAGVNVNSVVDEQGTRPLLCAASMGNIDVVRMLAVYPGVMLDIPRSDGMTAVCAAGGISDHKEVAILLAAGANPTSEISIGKNVIHEAVQSGKVAVVEAVMVHAKKYLNSLSPQGTAPLHDAVTGNHTIICSLLAAEASVDLNIKWQGVTANLYTPLHLAAFKSYWSVIECLVGWGADLNSTDRIGYTPVRVIIVRKSDVKPTSPTLKMVQDELSVIAGGKEVEGYIAVVCFLVHEGAADWHIGGVSPRLALPPAAASLIAEYLKRHPEPGTFHGSLRREQQQRRMQELPLPFNLALHLPPSFATTAAASATATDNLDSKTTQVSKAKDYVDINRGDTDPNTLFSTLKSKKGTDAPEKLASDEAPQQIPATAAKLSTSSPTVQLSPGASQPGGVSRQPCLLCEEHPAIIKFSPCGHTLLCSRCAERAKKCLQCKTFVESKSIETD